MHLRVFVGPEGITTFAPLDLTEMAAASAESSARMVWSSRPAGSMQDWHNADCPMFIVTLRGEMEVEIEGGRTARFGPGDVRLALDTTGPGHVSRVLGTEPWSSWC